MLFFLIWSDLPMAVFFWYPVTSCFFSIRCCTIILMYTRQVIIYKVPKTRPCLTVHPVADRLGNLRDREVHRQPPPPRRKKVRPQVRVSVQKRPFS